MPLYARNAFLPQAPHTQIRKQLPTFDSLSASSESLTKSFSGQQTGVK